jgi:hypothetical protein
MKLRALAGSSYIAFSVGLVLVFLFHTADAQRMLQLSCLVLGLGGLQRDREQNRLGFTLALPVSRIHLVASRAALGMLQVVALSAVPSLLVTAASHLAGEQLSLDYALRFIPLWAAGGIFTLAVFFLASVLFSSEYVSLAVVYMAYVFYLAAVRHPSLRRFHLHTADFMSGLFPHYLDHTAKLWTNTYPLFHCRISGCSDDTVCPRCDRYDKAGPIELLSDHQHDETPQEPVILARTLLALTQNR